jgi:ferric-dicitrate binding protein FerR (iron transport regulator)
MKRNVSMRKIYYAKILRRYRQGKATEAERRFLESYFDLFESDPGIKDMLSEEEKIALKSEIKDNLRKSIDGLETKVRYLPDRKTFLKIAAVLILILCGSYAYYAAYLHLEEGRQSKTTAAVEERPIEPIRSKAILTLANGRRILLDSAEGKTIAHSRFLASAPDTGQELFNTVTTPLGSSFQMTLPDGTIVWMNAGSSLRYPVRFRENRNVELSGEAYFDVKQDENRPFQVNVGDFHVQVLGTAFNICAYRDGKMEATLAKGKVKVANAGKDRLLYPGEQATLCKDVDDILIKKVNVDQVVSWKNGEFYFDNTNIKQIMHQISRSYDVHVAYAISDFSNKNFTGIISNKIALPELLKQLELTNSVHFSVKDRTITVSD